MKTLYTLLLFSTLFSGCSGFEQEPPFGSICTADAPKQEMALAKTSEIPMAHRTEPRKYSGCEELQADAKTSLRFYQSAFTAQSPDTNSSGVSTCQLKGTATVNSGMPEIVNDVSASNLQEQGVDEGDLTRSNKDQIFIFHHGKIEVLSRDTFNYLGTLILESNVDNETNARNAKNTGTDALSTSTIGNPIRTGLTEMYTNHDHLVVVREISTFDSNQTQILIYRTEAGVLPEKVSSLTLDGSLAESRLIEKQLTLLLRDRLELQEDYDVTGIAPDSPVQRDHNGLIRGIACDQIFVPPSGFFDYQLTKVVSLNIDTVPTGSKAYDATIDIQSTAFLGNIENMYMSENHIVLSQYLNSNSYYALTDQTSDYDKTIVFIAELASYGEGSSEPLKKLTFDYGIVPGYVKDRWSIKELSGEKLGNEVSIDKKLNGEKQPGEIAATFSVASTTGNASGWGSTPSENHLTILGKTESDFIGYHTISTLGGFGRNEDIRAVRYIGRYAYVVTFEKTDPLYIINLTDVKKPVIEGELHVPGFSTYLHPIQNQELVGIGFDAVDMGDFSWFQGIQVSLFDISKPAAPLRTFNQIIGDRGSSSEATWNSHAFFSNQDSSLIGFPVTEVIRTGKQMEPFTYGDHLTFIGADLFRPIEQTLSRVARLSHQPLLPSYCIPFTPEWLWWNDKAASRDIRRMFELDGYLVTVSDFAIARYPLSNLGSKPDSAFTFIQSKTDCPNAEYRHYAFD